MCQSGIRHNIGFRSQGLAPPAAGCEAKVSIAQPCRRQRSKSVNGVVAGEGALASCPSGLATPARDCPPQISRWRPRCEATARTRIGPTAVRAPEGRIQEAGVDSVLDGCAAAAAVFFQRVAMTRTASGAGALVHHAVISELHALRAKAQPRVHGPRAVSGLDPVAQRSPGNREGSGQNWHRHFDGGRSDALVGVDLMLRKLSGHDVAGQGVHASELPGNRDDRFLGRQPTAIEEVAVRRAEPAFVERQDREHVWR